MEERDECQGAQSPVTPGRGICGFLEGSSWASILKAARGSWLRPGKGDRGSTAETVGKDTAQGTCVRTITCAYVGVCACVCI